MITHLPECRCLNCDEKLNTVSGLSRPSPGDLNVCFRCGAVMMFADDLTVRPMSKQEVDALTADSETLSMIGRYIQYFRRNPPDQTDADSN